MVTPVDAGGGFIRWIELDDVDAPSGYPFDLPVIAGLRTADRLHLDPGVTFLVGDNGTGKSTLIEAIAVAAGFNAEGGTSNFRFATRSTESNLGGYLTLVRSVTKPRTGFFLRAESLYNVATEIDRLGAARSYGGRSLHERSHGESFLDVAVHRFGPQGLYILDEPEAALSVNGCMALILRIVDLVRAGSQFIAATHSPVLLAVPGAAIVQIGADGALTRVGYDDAEPVALTRAFLGHPDRYVTQLLTEG
jgi:predicted ATPase